MGLNAARIQGAQDYSNPGVLTNAVLALAVSGRLFLVTSTNTGGVNQWLQIFDSATAPAGGAVPRITIQFNAGQIASADFGAGGLPCKSGIWVGNSTTAATYTAGAADCLIDVAFTARL